MSCGACARLCTPRGRRTSAAAFLRRIRNGRPPMSTTRLVTTGDARVLAELLLENRAFLAPWEPIREDRFFTPEGQFERIRNWLREHAEGRVLPQVILDDAQRVVGCITLNNIVRGPFLSSTVGYWLSESHNGRGLATKAVAETVETAFADVGLHRLEAGTLPHNTASQRVLLRNGFTEFGRAPDYLRIAGEWQEHILYQLINPRW